MKMLPFFCLLIVAHAVRAETVSLASAFLFEAKDSPALTQSASLFARYERCVFFAFISADMHELSGIAAFANAELTSELAGQIRLLPAVTLLGGNLVKGNALSRLANPVIVSYLTPTGRITLPRAGVGSAVPRTSGSHAGAVTLRFVLPAFSGAAGIVRESSVELYSSGTAQGLTLAVPLASGKTAARFTSSYYAYHLKPAVETAWHIAHPYFAPGGYSAFLAEASVRSLVFRLPVRWYGAAGFAESPFGGYVPWFRSEGGFSAAPFALRARIFYSPADFYTPENRLIASRFRYSVNPSVAAPRSLKHGLLASGGVVFSGDSFSGLYTVRGSSRISAGHFTATALAGFENWLLPDGCGVTSTADTAFPLRLSLTARFPHLRASSSFRRIWYPGKDWSGTKTQHLASLSLSPRAQNRWYIPAGNISADIISYKSGKVSGDIAVALKWRVRTKKLTVSGKATVSIPVLKDSGA
jgi:hypothetical protein